MLAADEIFGMSPTAFVALLALFLGNGTSLAILLTGYLNRRKTAAEASKAQAEGGKISGDTYGALIDYAMKLLDPYTKQVAELSLALEKAHQRNRELQAQLDAQQEQIVALQARLVQLGIDLTKRENGDAA